LLLPLVKIEEAASRRTPIDVALDHLVEPLAALGERREVVDVDVIFLERSGRASPTQCRFACWT